MEPSTGKRKSRFDDSGSLPPPKKAASADDIATPSSASVVAAAAAAARAAEISKELSNKIALVSSLINNAKVPAASSGGSAGSNSMLSGIASVMPNLGGMASVLPDSSSCMNFGNKERKASYIPLLLDHQGREIDQFGNVVKRDMQIKTLAANKAVEKSKQKKNNPYLAHRQPAAASAIEAEAVPSEGAEDGIAAPTAAALDERVKTTSRDIRGKKSLIFVEAGKLSKEADEWKAKEERKLIAGYASGRKALQQQETQEHETEDENKSTLPSAHGAESTERYLSREKADAAATTHDLKVVSVPAASDGLTSVAQLPSVEWWDEAFLPKPKREELRSNRQQSTAVDPSDWYNQMALNHARTYKLVQHPAPCKPLSAAAEQKKQQIVLPTYLTKQERKKLRRATRQERETEKRDKMMMGLIPAPEPKFKLSNFMKVLGDQAVADPSKVEMKVLEQMQQRVLNHEMRNQAAKLTPHERKEKKVRKLQEQHSISTHGVQVAVFRIKNFSNLKYRFKVDVNAQQHFLSGIVLLCGAEGRNLVVVEGGPKGVRKFVRLMTERIRWDVEDISASSYSAADGVADGGGADGVEGDDDDSSNDGEGEGESGEQQSARSSSAQISSDEPITSFLEVGTTMRASTDSSSMLNNRCDLLWQGNLPKRVFTGFKFQESKTSAAARKMLKSRGVEHYWDMVEHADSSIASSELANIF